MASAVLAACGGNFAPTTSAGGSAGAGGMGNGSGGKIAADASILIDGNATTCPAMIPQPYSPCPSADLICDYEDGMGCPHRYTCTTQTSSFVAVGVGGASTSGSSQIIWISNAPMPGDACKTPGKVCSYPETFPDAMFCTDGNVWATGPSSSTTTEGMSTTFVSTTSEGSTVFTAGGQGGGSNTGTSSGAGGLGDNPTVDAGHP
jgi:hypothetical protein